MFVFPWSNLHELNLDWILSQVKKFSELIPPMSTAVEEVQALQTDVEQAVEDANTALEDAAAALETAEEAKDIAEQAAQGTIADGAVTTPKLDDGAVTTAKIADGAVTGNKIGTATIQTGNLSQGCVTTLQILDGTITVDDLGTGCVTSDKLGISAVTTSKINDGAVTTDKLDTGAVTNAKIYDGAINSAKLGSDLSALIEQETITLTPIPGLTNIISTVKRMGKLVTGFITATNSTGGTLVDSALLFTGLPAPAANFMCLGMILGGTDTRKTIRGLITPNGELALWYGGTLESGANVSLQFTYLTF